jgi:flagellar hook assembly protein FlgD
VSITVSINEYPGSYALKVYNSAGEHIKTIDEDQLSSPLSRTYPWDGTNKYGDKCATGVYVIYLIEPLKRKLARVILVNQ